MFRSLLTLALALPLLAACQLSPIGGSRDVAAAANPITGGEIAVTTLDAPASPAASSPAPNAAVNASASGTAPPQRPTAAAPAEPAAEPAPAPAPTPALAPAPAPAPAPVVPQASKSASQIACEEDGGNWARAGESVAMTCIRPTGDGGQRCDSKSDCDGECLARSRTCSPIKPLFGCNPVLMDTGAEVTLCIE